MKITISTSSRLFRIAQKGRPAPIRSGHDFYAGLFAVVGKYAFLAIVIPTTLIPVVFGIGFGGSLVVDHFAAEPIYNEAYGPYSTAEKFAIFWLGAAIVAALAIPVALFRCLAPVTRISDRSRR